MLFRQFDIPNQAEITKALLDHIESEFSVFHDFRQGLYRFFTHMEGDLIMEGVPQLWDFFDQYSMNLTLCAMICVLPIARVSPERLARVHRDHSEESLALNWPLINYENTLTEFFRVLDDSPGIHGETSDVGGSYRFWPDRDQLELIGSCTIDRPTLMPVHIPHAVTNFTDSPRWALSFRFTPAPTWLLED